MHRREWLLYQNTEHSRQEDILDVEHMEVQRSPFMGDFEQMAAKQVNSFLRFGYTKYSTTNPTVFESKISDWSRMSQGLTLWRWLGIGSKWAYWGQGKCDSNTIMQIATNSSFVNGYDWLTSWLAGWLSGSGWVGGCVCEWVSEWVNEWASEWVREWVYCNASLIWKRNHKVPMEAHALMHRCVHEFQVDNHFGL